MTKVDCVWYCTAYSFIIACVENHTHLFFFFYYGYIMFIYFASHNSSLIGLPFPPSFVVYCFCSCDVRSNLVYIDGCSGPSVW